MAEFIKERYTRTNIPICSLEYKKVLSDVKRNKMDMEDKDAVIKDLKKSFDELCVSRKLNVQPSSSVIRVNDSMMTATVIFVEKKKHQTKQNY
jgi:hypothetical protein